MDARLIVLIPESLIQQQAHESIKSLTSALVWLLIIGLALIIALVTVSVLPLINVAEHAAEFQPRASGIHVISDMVENMEHHNLFLTQKLYEHQQNIHTICVNRMIHGNASERHTIYDLVAAAQLPLNGSQFRGVLVEIPILSADKTAVFLTDVFREFPRLTFLQAENTNVLACVFASNGVSTDEIRTYFAPIYESVRTLYGIELIFYVGIPSDSLERIPQSFSSARWLITRSERERWLYIDKDLRPGLRNNEVMPSESEKRLIGAVLTGNLSAMETEIDELYQRCCVENNVIGFQRQYLYCRLIGALVKRSDPAAEELFPDHLLQLNTDEFFGWIRSRFQHRCEAAQQKSTQRSLKIVNDVRKYIEENYADLNISLNMLASHFGITANYLSDIFKHHIATNFSTYLEQIRLLHAEDLLINHSISVDEVAQQVGYTSSDSFRRAYKRSRGISPSKFREQIINKESSNRTNFL